MIALHAGRSAASIRSFAQQYPGRALIVVLTGTDLYGGIDGSARRSLDLATRLVVLNALGMEELPARWRAKTELVLPSATSLPPLEPRHRTFDVAIVGHLRAVKDPRLPMRIARHLPQNSRIRLLHAGEALERGWARAARATARSTERYRWLGALPAAAARTLMRRTRLLLHPSKNEGGATVIVEALQSGTPVIASDCAGNLGLLGPDYPALFAVGDMEAALADTPWLAGKDFSLADVGYAPYLTRLDHLQLQFLWDKRPHIAAWYQRLMERRAYKEALEDWFNPSYLSLMKEKGAAAQSRVKAIIASS